MVGDVYRSTPCRVRRDRAVTSCRHDPCWAAHDVPLRGWWTDALPILAPTALARSPVPTPASGLCHRTCLKPSSAPSPPALPRATVIGNATACHTRYEDPALLTEVAGQLPRQRPMRCRYRDLDSLSPVGRPRPPPQEVRLNRWHENSKAVFPPTNPAHVPAQSPRWRAMQRALNVARARSTVVCSCDALSARASGGASPPGQPRSGFRGVPMQDRDDLLFLRQAPHRLFPAANPGRRPGSESCGSRIRGATSTPGNRAGVHRAACFRLRLRLRRDTSLCCSGTGSRAPSSRALPYSRFHWLCSGIP
jgi:hypothetical protein